MKSLEEARNQIDTIDQEMARLFEQRLQIVESVIKYKIEHNLPILDTARESQVIEKNSKIIQNENYLSYYLDFMQHLMKISKAYQHHLSHLDIIGFQGTEGAFSQIALSRLFPQQKAKAYPSFEDVFKALDQGDISKAVLPFENSYTGEVGEVFDLLYQYDVKISSIYDLKIEHHLLGLKDASLSDITDVYSHEQALNQCKHFLSTQAFKLHAFANTALAAKHVSEKNDHSCAAIASLETAEYFGLQPLVRNIQSASDNTTRFIVLSKKAEQTGNRLSFMFTVDHQAGSLAKVISAISKHGFNMENIKSRTVHNQAWKYYFYVEIQGSHQELITSNLFEDFKRYCQDYKYLGNYTKQDH
jgi:chorismate mutase / prephenate dehydratase